MMFKIIKMGNGQNNIDSKPESTRHKIYKLNFYSNKKKRSGSPKRFFILKKCSKQIMHTLILF